MKHLTFLFFLLSVSVQAQFQVSGIVRDENTKKPLPFATITDTSFSTVTDVDGKFLLQNENQINSFTISYIGYAPKTIAVTGNKKYYDLLLVPKAEHLDEIQLTSSENPANGIISKAIKNKKKNDPQQKLLSFQFKSYNKLIVSANPDSIDGSIDSVFVERYTGREFKNVDSTNYKFKKIIDRQHLFQTEKVSQFQFNGKKLKETILGTKMAGFRNPIYEIIAFNLQSFSVYDSKYELFETKYNSPIAPDAFKDYRFKILDTVKLDNRDTYMIYFKPKKKRKSSGLEGIVYIDKENYAIAKAIMRIRGVLDISATHEFEYLEGMDIWFPTQKEFKIVKGKNDDDIRILGGTIKFEGDLDNNNTHRKKDASDFTYLLSKSYNFGKELNTPVKIRHDAIAIEIKDDAVKKDEAFWNSFRKDSLDSRSERTYFALDSIAQKERLEKKLRLGRKILNGYVPIGPVDMDLRYLLSYNNYEGFRVGLGGITNEKFSNKYRLDGYTAYGTKDGDFKYSIGGAVRVGIFSNSWIGGGYTDDVREIASTSFAIDKRVFKIYDPRPINLSTFYNHKTWRGYIETKILPKTESIWQLTHSRIEPKFNYIYTVDGKSYTNYDMTTAMVSLQWNPFSDYMQTPTGKLEIEKRYPKFTFQFTQSLPKVFENDFAFSKIDVRAEYEKRYLNGQRTALLMEAGYALGDVPISHLYNTSPNSLTKEKLIERITIAGKNSFETMYFNEFFSSKYVMFQLKHGFKRVTVFKGIKPSLVLVSRMAWGDMEKPEQHIGLNYKTLRDGYFESGIELNQIYKAFGLSGFYRYGPNQLAKFEDNLSIKLTVILNLGL
ncbi:MAG: hypothetical protein BGO88_07690 [Flavobacterium sp. 38-13]|uniref:DUF5686 and carboxypeptidase-like regulatory domain-containing protein n=1 Tax=Flavobacterium sp. 38-13 TaxID=1896168 RepID=UPI0009660DD7|nr:DUF5686 and carboxypeptidase-like regulatory domain-containing protein [Flavobacterium sp. 38-13]OJX51063.1 MAG: hypothetical protein BGO88_07690 [Flavobacterium sp. 38-13]